MKEHHHGQGEATHETGFGVSLFDQVNVTLWGPDAFLRFLLKGMQNINPTADL